MTVSEADHAALHSRVNRKSCGDATVNGGRLPAAWEISVAETIALLEADFPGMAGAVARGSYALWLGSGISLDRVVGVPAVIGRVIEYLRSRMDAGNPECRYKVALNQVLANLSPPEREKLHLDLPIDNWPEADRRAITSRLAGFYAVVLETPLEGEAEPDFLLWEAVDVPGSFTGSVANCDFGDDATLSRQ